MLLIAVVLNDTLDRSYTTMRTFDKCKAELLVYDMLPQGKNTYKYLEGVYVKRDPNRDEYISTELYQFLDDCEYDDLSIINVKNVVKGDYRVLENGEIAVPLRMAKKNDLSVGSELYLNNKLCKVVFIFADVYRIYEVNFSSNTNAVFVGKDTFSENDGMYCAFIVDDGKVHNRIEPLLNVKKKLSVNTVTFAVINTILTLIALGVCSIFRIRDEKRMLRQMKLFGKERLTIKIVTIEAAYVLLPTAIAEGIAALCGVGGITLIIMAAVGAFWFVFETLFMNFSYGG